MPFFFLVALSIILAVGGLIAGWLGLDDRSPGLLTGGAVAIGSAALLVGMALLLRELRASRQALIETLAGRATLAPAASQPVPVEQPAPLAEQPQPQPAPESAADAALATFTAGLAEHANRPVDKKPAFRFPPLKREPPPTSVAAPAPAEAPEPVIAAKVESETPAVAPGLPVAPLRPEEPPKVEEPRPTIERPLLDPLRPAARREGESLLKPSFRFRPLAEPPVTPAPPPLRAEREPDATGAGADADRPLEAVAEKAPSVAPPRPPDIDMILNEIIARRDRALPRGEERPRALGLGAPAEPLQAAVVGHEPELPKGAGVDREEEPVRDARAAAGPMEPAAAEPETGEGEPEAIDLVEPIEAVEAAPEPELEAREELAIAVAEGALTGEALVESELADKAIAEPHAEAPEAPHVAAHDHGTHDHHAAADEPAPVVEPEPETEPASAAPLRKMVRSFSSGPNRYTMYDDGSIEAETPTGRLTFASFDELRRYIDERMNQRSTGT